MHLPDSHRVSLSLRGPKVTDRAQNAVRRFTSPPGIQAFVGVCPLVLQKLVLSIPFFHRWQGSWGSRSKNLLEGTMKQMLVQGQLEAPGRISTGGLFLNLEGAGNHRKPQIVAENRSFSCQRETKGGRNSGEGKTYHKSPPQTRFWTPPLKI